MVIFPKAKINLGLTVSGKRPDGYHNIETIFYQLNFCDALEIVVRMDGYKSDQLTVTGLDLPGPIDDNLVMAAVGQMRKSYSFPFLKMHLHKVIPAGAGLGGGSSDAAGTLNILNKLFDFSISNGELKSIALGLGSDCPFFIDGNPVVAVGRGEIFKPVNNVLRGLKILLLNPGIQVNTREAYENCIPSDNVRHLDEIITMPVADWKRLLINDFERTIFLKYPLIGYIKEKIYESGALFSSMSGSGSSVFGIFKEEPVVPDDLKEFVIFQGDL
jgi:4-diphosphocytidyl-2-C-methyl-D-erythritol kinase